MFNRGFIVHNISKLFVKYLRQVYSSPFFHFLPQRYFKEERNDILNTLYKVCLALLIVGGLNWGLVGILNFDLVAFIFGEGSLLARIVYTIVGVAAVCAIPSLFSNNGDDTM